MPWIETSSGRFERPFDSLEQFYRAIAAAGAPLQLEHYHITSAVKVSPLPSTAQIRHAWKTMRHDYPLLAAVGEGDKYVYTTPKNNTDIESWLNETLVVLDADDQRTTADLCRRPKLDERALLYLVSRSSELVFMSSHWRIDGIGTLQLQDALLQALATPRSDDKLDFGANKTLSRLTPGIDEAAGGPQEDTAERTAAAMAMMNFLGQNPATVAFVSSNEQIPGPTGRLRLTLSKKESRVVLTGCKLSGFSVSTAAHAALILAAQIHASPPPASTTTAAVEKDVYTEDVNDNKDTTEAAPPPPSLIHGEEQQQDLVYTDLLAVSLRPYLPPPYNSASTPVTIYHTGIPLTVKVPSPTTTTLRDAFQSIAKSLSLTYRRNLRSSPDNLFDYLSQWVNAIVSFYTSAPTDAPPPALPDLSSLGIVETHLKPVFPVSEETISEKGQNVSNDIKNGESIVTKRKEIVVEDWWIMVQMLDRHIMSHLWTKDEQVNLQVVWNEAFYEDKFIEALLNDWKRILLDVLTDI